MKMVHRRGKRWVIDFRRTYKDLPPFRVQKIAKQNNKEAALQEAQEYWDNITEYGTPFPESRQVAVVVTLGEFVADGFTTVTMPTWTKATQTRYESILKNHILPQFGSVPLDQIRQPQIRVFNAYLLTCKSKAKGKSITTKGPLRLLMTIINCARDQGVLPKNYQEDVDNRALMTELIADEVEEVEALESEEVSKRLEAAKGHWVWPMAYTAASTGLRAGEIRFLRVEDVNFVKGVIFVRGAFSENEESKTKTKRQRKVPMTEELAAEMAKWCRLKLPGARIFTKDNGKTPRRQEVLAAWYRIQVGMAKRWSFHSLRHYFCTTLGEANDIKTVQALAGHTSTRVTERYMHARDRIKMAAIATMPKLTVVK